MLKEQRRGQKGETHTPKIEAQSNHKEFSLALFFTFFSLCEKETQRWVPSRPLCDLARGQNSNPTHTGRMWLPVDGSGKRLMEGGGSRPWVYCTRLRAVSVVLQIGSMAKVW